MCDDEWLQFCSGNGDFGTNLESENEEKFDKKLPPCPKAGELYISTKSKIGYLTKEIDLANVFWRIPTISYHNPVEGVIKKQIKLTLTDEENIEERLLGESIYEIEDISKRKNKIVKKISIGTSTKDLISYRCKKKGAFYNCFVIIYRVNYEGRFKEMHVKIFNTGKVEIPGVPKDELLDLLLGKVMQLFNSQPLNLGIEIKDQSFETVLINSNFNCGFNIHREKLVELLKFKYQLSVSYDPCSYPGIMCKFYYYRNHTNQTGKMVTNEEDAKDNTLKPLCISFMIFRTGSVLIVGKCDKTSIIEEIYNFIKNILMVEYQEIFAQSEESIQIDNRELKKKKIKKRKIIVFD